MGGVNHISGTVDETQQRRQAAMEWCDRQTPAVRSLIHVHGYAKVRRLVECEGLNAGEIREWLEGHG